MPINTKKPRYNSIQQYVKLLRQFPRTGNVHVGRFYTYAYNFMHTAEWDELKFYDHIPLTFIFDRSAKHMTGINFHHIPPKAREMWIQRVKQISQHMENPIEIRGMLGGRPIYKIKGLNYPKVYQILRKSKIAIRKYRLEEVHQLRSIDIRVIDEVMKYYSKTYLAVNINHIRKRYASYRP